MSAQPIKRTEQTLYGLPAQVVWCKRCVLSNQRPASAVEYAHTAASRKTTLHIDAEGVCDACRVAERKAAIDWTERDRELRDLLERYRSADGSYDVVVPGSGGKDSFYAAHVLKEKYGMHPLLVTWAPALATDWGRRNLERWTNCGDHILHTPKRSTHRLMTRLAVENLFHAFQPFIIGQKSLAPKIAARYGIPLVFFGESESEYGNPRADHEKAQRDWDYFCRPADEVFLGGVSVDELQHKHSLTRADLAPYMPANPEALLQTGVSVHYLGYYLRWHPQSAYYYSVEHRQFEPSPHRTPGTYSKYNSIDDKIDDLHYFTTHVKFGIGRATYDASQEVRSGDITRDEAVALVKRYDGEWPERFEDELMDYLSPPGFAPMTKESFLALSDRFRSPHLWNGRLLRHTVWA